MNIPIFPVMVNEWVMYMSYGNVNMGRPAVTVLTWESDVLFTSHTTFKWDKSYSGPYRPIIGGFKKI
jgi:hypothetical protein